MDCLKLNYLPAVQSFDEPLYEKNFEKAVSDIVGKINGSALRTIYTYVGERGTNSPIYYEETFLFKKMLSEIGFNCDVIEVYDDEFYPENWNAKNSLLHIPGAMSSELDLHLGKKVDAIRKFVMDGGSFIGWCGGAYWACGEVNYRVSENETLVRPRELQLWKGKEVGPLLPYLGNPEGNIGFFHGAVSVHWQGSDELKQYFPNGLKVNVLLSGGGSFIASEEEHPHTILGTYTEFLDAPVAAVCTRVGKGISVLVNPYFTHGADYFRLGLQQYKAHFPSHPWDRIVEDLTGNDALRKICFTDMLWLAVKRDG